GEPARGRARGGPHAAALPTLWLDLLRQPSAGGRGARHAGRAPPLDAPGAAALRGDLGPARRIPRGGGAPRGVLTSRAAGGAGDEGAAGPVRRFRPRYGPKGFPLLTLVYRVMPGPGRLRPGDDVSEARWFRRRAIPYREIAFPGLRRLLRRWVSGR